MADIREWRVLLSLIQGDEGHCLSTFHSVVKTVIMTRRLKILAPIYPEGLDEWM